MKTIGQRFDAKSNNFDLVRLFAACLVIYSHSFSLLGQREPIAYWVGGYDTGGGWAVSIFFVISGFLIARSCLSRPVSVYLASRIVRILPALAALLAFDVLIIGPIFSSLSLREYFSSADTFKHLLSISIFYQYNSLPGVFSGGAVNGTIWTLPLEFVCYILLPIFCVFGCLKRWLVIIPLAIIANLYFIAVQSGLDWANQGGEIFFGLPYYSTLKNGLFFMIGTVMWVHRDDIPLSAPFAVLALLLLVSGALGFAKTVSFYVGLSYLTIYVCIVHPLQINLQKWPGDLSYGVYLYGFPIQQSLIAYGLVNIMTPVTLSAIALPITLILASASWWLIERPSLRWVRRRQIDSVMVAPSVLAS